MPFIRYASIARSWGMFESQTAGQDRGVIFYRDVSRRASSRAKGSSPTSAPSVAGPGPTGPTRDCHPPSTLLQWGPRVPENSSAWAGTRESTAEGAAMTRRLLAISLMIAAILAPGLTRAQDSAPRNAAYTLRPEWNIETARSGRAHVVGLPLQHQRNHGRRQRSPPSRPAHPQRRGQPNPALPSLRRRPRSRPSGLRDPNPHRHANGPRRGRIRGLGPRMPLAGRIRAHLLRWRPRPGAQRRETTPRARPSGAASQLDPSPPASPLFANGARTRRAPDPFPRPPPPPGDRRRFASNLLRVAEAANPDFVAPSRGPAGSGSACPAGSLRPGPARLSAGTRGRPTRTRTPAATRVRSSRSPARP